jgi:hypothetical protein
MSALTLSPSAALTASVKRVLSPRLRAVGFMGGPRIFFRLYPEVWLCLRLNRMSSAGGASFTGDVGISSRKLLESRGLDANKPPPPREWHREQRIGSLLAGQFDQWWTVESGQPAEHADQVVADFADSFVDKAIPAISPLLSNRGLLDVWRADRRFLSPPEVGDLQDLERAIGEELTEIPVRSYDAQLPQEATGLAPAIAGLLEAGANTLGPRGGSKSISVSLSDPNARLRQAIEEGDIQGLSRMLTSTPWGLKGKRLSETIESLGTDPSGSHWSPKAPGESHPESPSHQSRRTRAKS